MINPEEIQAPLIYNNEKFHSYGVHKEKGGIYSIKAGFWQPLAWCIGGNMKYPFTSIIADDGRKKSTSFHIATCETLKPIPIPSDISDEEWAAVPDNVKNLLRKAFQVNHIDHCHTNFRPNNLEWVTGQENAAKYQIHRKNEVVRLADREIMLSEYFTFG